MRYCWMILFIGAWPWLLLARAPLPESALDGHLRWGRCQLEVDDYDGIPRSIWPIACIRPRVSTQLILRDDKGKKNLAMLFARIYAGVHANQYVSAHGDFIAQRLFRLGNKDSTVVNGARPQSLFLQFGNVAVSRWRMSAGLLEMPFGLDFRPLMEVYDEFIKTRKFWSFPRFASKLTFDTQVSSQFEFAYATDKLDSDTEVRRRGQPSQNEAIALRTMFDIAALDGFRFVFSGYGDQVGERRGGVGLVNIARSGDQSVFEYVRLRPKPSRDDNFDQLFRFGFLSSFRQSHRWIAEYESDRNDYRMGTLGVDFIMPDYGLFRLAASYHKGWFKDQDDFFALASAIRLSL